MGDFAHLFYAACIIRSLSSLSATRSSSVAFNLTPRISDASTLIAISWTIDSLLSFFLHQFTNEFLLTPIREAISANEIPIALFNNFNSWPQIGTLFSINAYAKPVNVNTADSKTLTESLQGIGQKKAEAIVQYRTENGDFSTLSDLINVKGIGEKTVEKNAEDILFTEQGSSKKPKKEKKEKKSK